MQLFIYRYSRLAVVLLGLYALRVVAGPGGRFPVPGLAAKADAIVVGAVQSLATGATISATITVEQVLKGSILPGSSVFVAWTPEIPSTMLPAPSANARPKVGHGIFFLQRNPSGSWSLLPAAGGDVGWEDVYIRTPLNAPAGVREVVGATLPPHPTPLDRVLAEMVTALEAGAAVPYDLVGIARETRSTVLTAAFSRFLSKQDRLLTVGLRGSLVSGDHSAILAARRNYAALSSGRDWAELLQDVRSYYVSTEPHAIQVLGEVATDNTTGMDLRTAAAAALARMHTQQSLPYLAKLLAEDNITLKTMAVGGLAGFANNVPIGSHEPAAGQWPYRTDDTIAHSVFDERLVSAREPYYVGFWMAWWQQNQSKLLQ
jgi:hypothetical protein